MAPSSPNMLYAIVESNDKEKGVYRSTDFGQTWKKRSGHMTSSPQYYNELVVDPHNPERVYSLDTFTKVSEDGGKTFHSLSNEFITNYDYYYGNNTAHADTSLYNYVGWNINNIKIMF